MIEVKCETGNKARLSDMIPFQGDLKKRSEAQVLELATSLMTDGLITPFVLWRRAPDDYAILDGHGRYMALVKLALENMAILNQDFPVVIVEAKDENEARQQLLQINSQYGQITKTGLANFVSSIPDYKAPVLDKTFKVPKVDIATEKPTAAYEVIRLKVVTEQVERLKEILASVAGVRVL